MSPQPRAGKDTSERGDDGDEPTSRSEADSDGAPDEAPVQSTAIEALRNARKESRTVLDEQIRLLNDIDDKAMRSVRTAVVFLGIIISAIQVSGGVQNVPDPDTWVFRLSATGVGLLIISIVAGILTYSVSSPNFGVSEDHRKDVMLGYTEREWLIFLLNEYDEWTDEMERTNVKNSIGLHTTLFSLTSGLVCLLLSLVHELDYGFWELATPPLVGLAATSLFAIALYAINV